MSNPDPTRRPGVFQGPGDTDPQPIHPYVLGEDEMAAYFDGGLRRTRRRRLLRRIAVALAALVVAAAVLLAVAAGGWRPTSGPTTVPAPVTVPPAGATCPTCVYTPVPAGTP